MYEVRKMKIPKQMKRYCPSCRKHNLHKVMIEKVRARPKTKKHAFKWGIRHYAKISSGYTPSPRPIMRDKAKTSRRANIKYQCLVCKKMHFKQNPVRQKKLEQI